MDYRGCQDLWRKASDSWHTNHGTEHPGDGGWGYTVERIVDAYPELTREMIAAALAYAAAVVDEVQVIAHA